MEKTCGNCGNAIPIPIKEEDGAVHYDMISVCPCDWCIDLVRNEPEFVGHTPDTEPCEEWIEQKEQSLEQRYKHLAEVARDLFRRTLVAYGGEDVSIVEIDDYRKQLEELGVEL